MENLGQRSGSIRGQRSLDGSRILSYPHSVAKREDGQPMSSSEATGYLQDFINECLPLPDLKIDLNKIGTHSLKTGLLTMAARSTSIKFSMSERRTLGHHIKPSDRSVLTYSREAFTSLYAKVLACFQQIQAGSFRPDSTALERIMDAATINGLRVASSSGSSAAHL